MDGRPHPSAALLQSGGDLGIGGLVPVAEELGVWERVFTALVAQADVDEYLAWTVSVDSTIVRAHQHASGARKEGPWR
ncbi:hypothetical protein SAMN05216481_10996 [Streptomyces radiopugnans]|uniref:Transposase n=1 Tax=Streptomyces radiopugnans TaxID=403935 RepID=A0A1H9GMJ4_9ACTN|nr:hypothetical protein SAMN05216481_10996 [Streptomyces radiopugnans]